MAGVLAAQRQNQDVELREARKETLLSSVLRGQKPNRQIGVGIRKEVSGLEIKVGRCVWLESFSSELIKCRLVQNEVFPSLVHDDCPRIQFNESKWQKAVTVVALRLRSKMISSVERHVCH